MTWARRNVPVVVTWILILLGASGTLGYTAAGVDSVQADVVKLEAGCEEATTERATMRIDLRVNEERDAALSARFDRLAERIESAVLRLEQASHGSSP